MGNKVLFVALAVVFSQICMVHGGTVTYGNACSSTSDCLPSVGLTCQFLYTTCAKGACACATTEYWDSKDSQCHAKLSIGSSCVTTQTLPASSTCASGTVKCDTGYSTYQVSNCQLGTKALGNECADVTACIDPAATCETLTGASTKTCNCIANYKNVNGVCEKAKLSETCTVGLDCTSGVCGATSKTCECASTLKVYEGNCLAYGTVKVNGTCSVNALCELGLQCSTCPSETRLSCLKIKPTESGSTFVLPTIANIMASVCFGVLWKKHLF